MTPVYHSLPPIAWVQPLVTLQVKGMADDTQHREPKPTGTPEHPIWMMAPARCEASDSHSPLATAMSCHFPPRVTTSQPWGPDARYCSRWLEVCDGDDLTVPLGSAPGVQVGRCPPGHRTGRSSFMLEPSLLGDSALDSAHLCIALGARNGLVSLFALARSGG